MTSYFTIIFLFTTGLLIGQNNDSAFSEDTSYTLLAALKKENHEYPDAKLVAEQKFNTVIEVKELVYAKYDQRKLKLSLFSPEVADNEKLPLVLLIHGGGWASVDRSMLKPFAQQLSKVGFHSAAVEYRLSPESLYPAAVIDIITSIKWLKANAEKLNVDSSRIALLGTSAGGHLAALVGTNWNGIDYLKVDSLKNIRANVQAIIDIDGVLDLTHPAESGKDTNIAKPSVLKRWFGFTYKEKHELWKKASPINWIDSTTPPTLFINSSVPRFHAGRDEMIDKMNRYGICSEVHTLSDSPHSFWLFTPWFEPTKNYVI